MRRRLVLALVLAASPSIAAAEELRTLFHSPEERARLDRLRRGEPAELPAAARAPRVPAVTGFVKRSDGRDTVWFDGTPKAMSGADASKARERETPPTPGIEIKRSR